PLPTQTARKSRLRRTVCGQCEVKTAGIMCAECTENYCVGCFARFHHKGALKFHKMIPIQGASYPYITLFAINPCKYIDETTLLLQMLVRSDGEEKKVGITEDDNKGFLPSLLKGEYNEEESARSFQEALKLWRGKNDGTALPPDREAEGQRRGGGGERVPVKVKFTKNSLTYMDRLLLKKHRRYR
uniref:B box-type domain-containing protein n=1 Tax=Pundamilia nyererei TaxID=303518 RepID=A0A3B4FV86_9CICH